VTRDELLRRAGVRAPKTPEEDGQEFLVGLYLRAVVFFVLFFGILIALLFWNYPNVSEVEDDILAQLEMYLEGEGYFSKPFPEPYFDVEIGIYRIQKDYWETLRSGCSGVSYRRCGLNANYKIFLSYQADKQLRSGTFQLILGAGEWEVLPK
jgi:hypothetical protein